MKLGSISWGQGLVYLQAQAFTNYIFLKYFLLICESQPEQLPPHSDLKITLKKELVGDDQFQYFSRFKDLPFLPFIRKIHWPKLNVLGRCGAVPDDYFGKIL